MAYPAMKVTTISAIIIHFEFCSILHLL